MNRVFLLLSFLMEVIVLLELNLNQRLLDFSYAKLAILNQYCRVCLAHSWQLLRDQGHQLMFVQKVS